MRRRNRKPVSADEKGGSEHTLRAAERRQPRRDPPDDRGIGGWIAVTRDQFDEAPARRNGPEAGGDTGIGSARICNIANRNVESATRRSSVASMTWATADSTGPVLTDRLVEGAAEDTAAAAEVQQFPLDVDLCLDPIRFRAPRRAHQQAGHLPAQPVLHAEQLLRVAR